MARKRTQKERGWGLRRPRGRTDIAAVFGQSAAGLVVHSLAVLQRQPACAHPSPVCTRWKKQRVGEAVGEDARALLPPCAGRTEAGFRTSVADHNQQSQGTVFERCGHPVPLCNRSHCRALHATLVGEQVQVFPQRTVERKAIPILHRLVVFLRG